MKTLRIALGSDHAGYPVKKEVALFLTQQGQNIHDFGTYSPESVDYPDFAHPLAVAVEKGEYDLGLLFCGSGNGVNITANKHKGIRSALCWLPEIATLARQHNNANVCAIPARYVTPKQAIDIVEAFIRANFEEGRHVARVAKIE